MFREDGAFCNKLVSRAAPGGHFGGFGAACGAMCGSLRGVSRSIAAVVAVFLCAGTVELCCDDGDDAGMIALVSICDDAGVVPVVPVVRVADMNNSGECDSSDTTQ